MKSFQSLVIFFSLIILAGCAAPGEQGSVQEGSTFSPPAPLVQALGTEKLSGTIQVFDEEGTVVHESDLIIEGSVMRSEAMTLDIGQTYTFVLSFSYTLEDGTKIPLSYVTVTQRLTDALQSIEYQTSDIQYGNPTNVTPSLSPSFNQGSFEVPNLDSDGDGVSNFDEILDGTDPRDANSKNLLPTITFTTAPADNETVTGVVTIEGQVSDKSGIKEFKILFPAGKGTLSAAGELTRREDGTFTYTFNTESAENETLKLTFQAADTLGNLTSKEVILNILNLGEQTPPIITIDAFGNSLDQIEATITVAAKAEDPSGVVNLVLLSPANVADENTAPEVFRGVIDTTPFANGQTVEFRFQATDGNGNTALQSVKKIVNNSEDKEAPTLVKTLTAEPDLGIVVDNLYFKGDVIFSLQAQDGSGVQNITYVSGLPSLAQKDEVLDDASLFQVHLKDLNLATDGLYTWTFNATDTNGNTYNPTGPSFSAYRDTTAPTPNAGVDIHVMEHTIGVTLDGTLSSDGTGSGIAIYQWTQVGGTDVILNNKTTATPSFTAPAVVFSDSEAARTLTFSLIVEDRLGNQDSADEVNVIVDPTNEQAPTFNPLAGQDCQEYVLCAFTLSATDVDSQTLTFSVVSGLPAGASFNTTTGALQWVPDFSQAGSYEITFSVGDGELSDTMTVEITVNDETEPLEDQDCQEGSLCTFTVSGPNLGEGVALSAAVVGSLPNLATFNGTTRVFNWVPDFTQAGDHSVTFRLTSGDLVVDFPVAIEVTDTTPPDLVDPTDITQEVENAISFTVTMTGETGTAPFTVTASNLPSGASFNSSTRVFSWTPSLSQIGPYTVNFTATYGEYSETESVGITVTEHPAPILSGMTPQKGPTSGGTVVTITGSNFLSGVQVLIGGVAANVTSVSNNQITAITGISSSAQVSTLTVRNQDGKEDSVQKAYTYYAVNNTAFVESWAQSLTSVSHIFKMRMGDINGDGLQDVVIAYREELPGFSSYLDVYLANGDGTLSLSSQLNTVNTGAGTLDLAVQDINHDGFDDVIVLTYNLVIGQPYTSLLQSYLGNESGGLSLAWSQVGGQAQDLSSYHLSLGNFNGDDHQDLILIYRYQTGSGFNIQHSQKANLYLGNDNGSFNDSHDFLISSDHFVDYQFKVGNVNGDGMDDIVMVYKGSSTVNDAYAKVFTPDSDGFFTESWSGLVRNHPGGFVGPKVGIGDFNNDGYEDWISGSVSGSNGLIFLDAFMNNDGLGFTDGWSGTVFQNGIMGFDNQMEAVDVTGEGRDDLIVGFRRFMGTYNEIVVTVLTSDQDSTMTQGWSGVIGSMVPGGIMASLEAGDVDGDGINDLVVIYRATAPPPEFDPILKVFRNISN